VRSSLADDLNRVPRSPFRRFSCAVLDPDAKEVAVSQIPTGVVVWAASEIVEPISSEKMESRGALPRASSFLT